MPSADHPSLRYGTHHNDGDAETILIFGPGEAKGELKKRMERDKIGIRIVAMETADKMTEPQIVAKVKQRLF